jgi:4-amino-4-deoxy-L-arabinose transferase-like glycosyltransferase
MDAARESLAAGMKRSWGLWTFQVVAYALLASALPPLEDEVYYWTWSKSLQLSYFDHPGMVAWLIRLSTCLWGDTILGMRFPACCCLTFVFLVIGLLVQSPPRTSTGLLRRCPILIGLLLTPLFTFGAILITPDAPLLAMWAAYLWWLVAIQERLADDTGQRGLWRWWLIGGVILGLGGLSKYTMVLAVPSGFASFLLSRQPRQNWFWGYVGHGVVSAIVAAPILFYNLQHNFEPLLFQWRHAMHDHPASWQSFCEFWGVQVLLFGTLPLFLIPWTLRNLPSLCRCPRLRVCTCLFLIPLVFFVYKAAKTELEGNWALVMFVSVWPVVIAWYDTVRASRWWNCLAAAAFAPPMICVAGLAILLVSPVPLLPAKFDRLGRQRARWEMVQDVAAVIQARSEFIPTFTTTYQLTALLRFWNIDSHQEASFRASHYTFPPEHVTDVPIAYFLTDRPLSPEIDTVFQPPERIGTFPVKVRGEIVQTYSLWKLTLRTKPQS